MQTWAVALAGVVLGPKYGLWTVLVYILLGAIGAPVFSHFRGGLGVVLGATGGFIMTFPTMAWLAGVGAEVSSWSDAKQLPRMSVIFVACLLAAVAINLGLGMMRFAMITYNTLWAAFIGAVVPFILPEIFKMVAVIIVGRSIRRALKFAGIAPHSKV